MAPVLCNIFLSAIDRDLDCIINSEHVLKIFRYVGDFFIILKRRDVGYNDTVQETLATFGHWGKVWRSRMSSLTITGFSF